MPTGKNKRKASLGEEWFYLVAGSLILLIFLYMIFEYGPGVLLDVTPGGGRLSGIPGILFLFLALIMIRYSLKKIMESNKKAE